MHKELIISIVIVVIIVIGNVITQNYTNKSIEAISSDLNSLRQELNVDDVNQEKAREHFYEIEKKWDKMQEKMAYYIEHDELEKVKTNLTELKSHTETEEYEEAINDLDKSVFVLDHIEEKSEFNLKNIF